MSSFGSWTGSTVNRLRPNSHIWINPKTNNYLRWTQIIHAPQQHEQEKVVETVKNETNHPNQYERVQSDTVEDQIMVA
jgi:hypothetical protein